MSGHSKWSTIKRKKEKTDGQRAKIFTKIGREMAVAIKDGGVDPNTNSKLKELIAKAKENNVPNDNIERVIKKASGADKTDYFDMVYEGYGPCGVAVMVKSLTDNKNRTAADVRHHFDKYGGNLGQIGCVSFMFSQKGLIIIENKGIDEEKIMEDCLECGAEDFEISEEMVEITTSSADFLEVKQALLSKGYSFATAEITFIPSTYSRIDTPALVDKMEKLLELLEDNDDIQAVYHNWDSE